MLSTPTICTWLMKAKKSTSLYSRFVKLENMGAVCHLDSTGNAVRKIVAFSFASCYLHILTALLVLLIPSINSGPSCCTYMYTENFKTEIACGIIPSIPSRIVVKFYTKFCSILIAMDCLLIYPK